jgi:hypothetical protein
MFIGAGTENITIYRFDEGCDFFRGNGHPGFIDGSRAIHPGDSVVLLRDETIQAGNHVQGDTSSFGIFVV